MHACRLVGTRGWRGAGRDGKGPVAMDCWKHTCSIVCIVSKVIAIDCATCTVSRAAEGKQRQQTAGTRCAGEVGVRRMPVCPG